VKIKLSSIIVDDQQKALDFYTEKLGFTKKTDIPMGEFRWLTVVSPDEPDGTELVLEPNANPASRDFQAALYEQGIPQTALQSEDVQADYERLTGLGVAFRSEPADMGGTLIAMFDDTCGNFIQIYQA
jgi:catechol 2,3-dioxygenase-like lactoylglutathione lyase family enzyme